MKKQDVTSVTVFALAAAGLAVISAPWPYWAALGAAAAATAVVSIRGRRNA